MLKATRHHPDYLLLSGYTRDQLKEVAALQAIQDEIDSKPVDK